ncbi:MAG: hypothetical protein GX131_07425 [candidate division WS1 bacterium]|jgi:hypothetical protein|nr:hypothetical protein [candidate division WS1 bacterium]
MRSVIFCSFMLVIAAVAAVMAQTPIDQHTTFMASFDNKVEPDYAAGDWRAAPSGEVELVDGRFGQALHIPSGRSVAYNAGDKINLSAGTIEFWLLWTEELAAGEGSAGVFSMVTPEAGNYVNFNKIASGRLGMPVKQGPPGEGEWTWKRVDIDPSGWETPSWHHLAGTWEGGDIALYVDGELVGTETGGVGFVEAPEQFSLGRGPLTVDELRISSIARSAEEIAAVANAQPGERSTVYLTDLEPTASEQAVGMVGIDEYLAIDEREMPLVIGQTAYARGVAVRAPGSVEFEVPEGVANLRGVYGLSPFGREGADATLEISLNGQEAQVCTNLTAEDAQALSVPVQPGQTLRLEAQPVGDTAGAVVVLGDAMLLAEGIEPPPSFSRELTPDEMTLQQMRTQVAEFTFDLPDAPSGYVIYAGHPADDVDPALEPLGEVFPEALSIAAAPGEYEPAQFGLFAARDLRSVNVTASDLTGPGGAIGGDDVQVQLIRRVLMRKGYWMPALPANYETMSRFIFPGSEFWLPEGNFKEVYVLVHVPEDAQPGDYSGTISVAADGAPATEMALNLTVRPIELIQPTDKRYGMYYRANTLLDRPEEVNDAEFADMAAHGCTMIKGHTAITWARDDAGNITWDFGLIRATLDQARKHGFFGEITIYDDLMNLARLMGLKALDEEGQGDPVSENEELLAVARAAFAELKQLEAEYPEFEFLLTHMDEVFGQGRLERYVDYAEVIRRTGDFRIYITMHMNPGRWEEYIERADPWIDVRSINGHSLETWLQAGNTWEDLEQILAEAGDDGWIYHNQRGSFYRNGWNRFINGLFMWVSPLEVHVPWMYYSVKGNPFDDTDADGHDFVYAVPHPDDPTLMISTLHYENFREGYDDMRYIKTLEQLISQARAAGVDVAAAEGWLAEMRAMLPQLPEDIQGIELESPYTVAATTKFSGADWDAMRERTAQHIIALRNAMN